MGLIQRIRSMFGSDVSADGRSFLSGIFPHGLPPKRGSRELMMAYKSLPWLHAITSRIGANVASTCWRMYRAKGQRGVTQRRRSFSKRDAENDAVVMPYATEVLKHPFLDLLDRPNPTLHRIPFWSMLSVYLDLKGEAPMIIERAADGLPTELWLTPPHWLRFTPSAGSPLYQFQWNAMRRDVAETDVFYLSRPDPENPYGRGVGTGQALSDELDIDEFAAKHIAAYFYNRAMPDAFVSMKGGTEEQARLWEEQIRNKYRGSRRSWQVHVTNAELEVKTVAQNFKDLQMTDLRTIQRDTCIQVFGVPPEVMGIVENSNRSTATTADFLYAKHVLTPRLDFIADALTNLLAEWDESLYVAYESPVEEDADFQLEVMTAQPSLFTKNEWRKLAKHPPVSGWDKEFGTSAPGTALPGMPGAPALPAGGDGGEIEPAQPTKDEPAIDPDEDEDEERSVRPRLVAGG